MRMSSPDCSFARATAPTMWPWSRVEFHSSGSCRPAGSGLTRGGAVMGSTAGEIARARREQASRRYKPRHIKILLVAEAPPSALDRYFYFEDVAEHDSLLRYVARGILERGTGSRVESRYVVEYQRTGV